MQPHRKGWQAALAVSVGVLIVPALAYGQSRGAGPSGADSSYFSGSAATGQHGTSGSTDTPHSPPATARADIQAGAATDQEILQRIQQSIRADEGLAPAAQTVMVEVSDGVVTLRGPVRTEKVKADLGTRVEQVAGVRQVNNQLQVAPNLSGTTSGVGTSTSSDIRSSRTASRAAEGRPVESFPRTGSRDPAARGVPQQPGVPHLPGSGSMHESDRTGTTGPSGSRSAAVASGSIDPVTRTAKPAGDYAVTQVDRELVSRLRLALTDPQFNMEENNVHLVADNGEIILYGWVTSEQEKAAIDERVRAEAGVRGVDNRLHIAGGGSPLSANR